MRRVTLERILKIKSFAAAALLFFVLYWAIGTILPYLFDKEPSPEFVRLFKPQNCYATGIGPERVRALETPEEAIFWRLKLIEGAQERIRLSTYDIRCDKSGLAVMAALQDAAERGVKVELLVDGMCGTLRLRGRPAFQAFRSTPNITVKFHNPIGFFKPRSAMIRLHDKYLIADDSVYMLGGRNINDLFMDVESETCNFDRDVLVKTVRPDEDTSLKYLTNYFDEIWQLEDSRELKPVEPGPEIDAEQEKLRELYAQLPVDYPQLKKTIDWEDVTVPSHKVTILHNPIEVKHKEPDCWYAMTQLMAQGEHVTLQTPYVVLSRGMKQDIEDVVDNDTEVEIMTNSPATNANYWGAADYLNQKNRILKTGVTLYETALPVSNHAKAMLVDDRMSLIGSFNCDMRSAFLDTELMVAVDSPELNRDLRRGIDEHKAQSIAFKQGEEPVPGAHYEKPDCPTVKWILLQIFRVVILPIRHLL